MTVIELSRSPKRGSVPTIERQKGVVVVGDGTLDPVIQSTLGVVRESAGLLYHVAGFGAALVSGPKISRPKRGMRQTGSAAQKSANVISFPQLETSGHRSNPNRNKS
jgi:hypothetical protein